MANGNKKHSQQLSHVSHLNTIRYVQHVCCVSSVLFIWECRKMTRECSAMRQSIIKFVNQSLCSFLLFGRDILPSGQFDVLLANWKLFIIIASHCFWQISSRFLIYIFWDLTNNLWAGTEWLSELSAWNILVCLNNIHLITIKIQFTTP